MAGLQRETLLKCLEKFTRAESLDAKQKIRCAYDSVCLASAAGMACAAKQRTTAGRVCCAMEMRGRWSRGLTIRMVCGCAHNRLPACVLQELHKLSGQREAHLIPALAAGSVHAPQALRPP